eukprot:442468-Hanusia_phi.AAC.1
MNALAESVGNFAVAVAVRSVQARHTGTIDANLQDMEVNIIVACLSKAWTNGVASQRRSASSALSGFCSLRIFTRHESDGKAGMSCNPSTCRVQRRGPLEGEEEQIVKSGKVEREALVKQLILRSHELELQSTGGTFRVVEESPSFHYHYAAAIFAYVTWQRSGSKLQCRDRPWRRRLPSRWAAEAARRRISPRRSRPPSQW